MVAASASGGKQQHVPSKPTKLAEADPGRFDDLFDTNLKLLYDYKREQGKCLSWPYACVMNESVRAQLGRVRLVYAGKKHSHFGTSTSL